MLMILLTISCPNHPFSTGPCPISDSIYLPIQTSPSPHVKETQIPEFITNEKVYKMQRKMIILVVLLVAVAAIVTAEPPKAAPGGSVSTPVAESPDNIGPIDDPAGSEGGDDVVEGPVGGPTPLGEYGSATAPTGANGAAGVKIFAGVGGAAAALAGLFLY